MNGTELTVKRIPPADGEPATTMLALPPANLGPRELYRQATDVAGVCREIVCKTSKRIGNRDHVAVEGWQAIATTHGCMLSVKSVSEDEAGNVTAVACVRRMADGVELSEAEGFVGMDEKTWAGRQRYARRAMAQTRAMSRVARAAFAHVVILIDANLATTPAEEVGGDDEPAQHRPPPPRRSGPDTAKFTADFSTAVMKRGFTAETACEFLTRWLNHRKMSLEGLNAGTMGQLVCQAIDGAFDSWLRGIESPGGPADADNGVTEGAAGGPESHAAPPATPAAPVNTAEPSEHEKRCIAAQELAESKGMDAAAFKRAMSKVYVRYGVKGKESTLPAAAWDEVLQAIGSRAGYFA